MNRITALVPMRHHSQRVPNKNFRSLAGHPLYTYILDTLLQVQTVEAVVVDTDSPEIKAGLANDYPDVIVLDRPETLRGPEVSMNDVILWDLTQVPAEHYLQTHSTNPLLSPDTVSQALSAYLEGMGRYDSLFSVTRLQKRLWSPDGKPLNHDPAHLIQTQHLPPILEENSCLYIFSREGMVSHRNRIGDSPLLFEIPADEAWDIDVEIDLRIVESLMMARPHGA
jgi:CMP-N-acetylneuraminic acid synthetase